LYGGHVGPEPDKVFDEEIRDAFDVGISIGSLRAACFKLSASSFLKIVHDR